MSYVIALNRNNIIYSRNQERALVKQSRNKKAIIFLLILFIALFGILYIVQVNSAATSGYKIQKYKNELMELQSNNKNLELKLSEVRSLEFLEGKIENLNMAKAEKIDYISPISQVAAR